MEFGQLIGQIERNKLVKEEGGLTSIPPPFPRLGEHYGGFTKGSITCLTAASGVGKSKFAKYMTILNIYKQVRLNKSSIQPKIFYFALEESATDFWLSFISIYMYEKHKITISVQQLKSIGNYTMTNDLMAKVKDAERFIYNLQEIVEVVDYIRNPTGMSKYIRAYFDNPEIGEHTYKELEDGKKLITGYKYKSDDTWVFFILDHISLLSNEIAPDTKIKLSSYQTFDFMIKDYVLEVFSKRYKMINVIVHQQTPASEKQTYTYKGQLMEEKLEPSMEELHINKGVHQDYEIVIGLFSPARYNIATHNGYDVSILGNKYRSLKFLKDRYYGLENSSIGLYFNGANGEFQELPRPQDMNNPVGNHYERFLKM
jgi:energy-coupling factor transporter ATP-binding protein EcfA2